MAENTEEIAIKLGVSNYEFVTAVRDAEAEVDKLKKAGKAASEDNGLLKSFDEAKKGFREMKEVIEGAGMLKLLGEFFNGAIEYAKNYKGAMNENVEAVKQFGEGYENLKVGFMGAGVQILGSVNRIGTAMGDAVKYWAAAATGSTDAWMKNEAALEASEKSLQSTLKLIKEQAVYAEQNKKIGQEMAAIREKEKDYDLKKLTDLEQINALENRNRVIQQEIDSGKLNRFETNKAELELMKNSFALRQKEDELYTKNVAEQRKANEEQRAANLDKLSAADKQKIISREILDIQSMLNAKVLNASDTEYYTAQIKTRQLELTKAQVEEHKQMVELGIKEAESYAKALDVKREDMSLQERNRSILSEQVALKRLIEAADKTSKEYTFYMARDEALKVESQKLQKDLKANDVELAKLLLTTGGKLNAEEQERYNLLTGQTTAEKQQLEIKTLTAALLTGTITPAEKERLAVLTQQTVQLDKQQKIQKVTMSQAMMSSVQNYLSGFVSSSNSADQSKWDSMTTTAATKQITDQMKGIQDMIDNFRSTGNQWGEYQIPALQGMIDTLRKRLSNVKAYAFDPSYSDALGEGIMASQVTTIGDPLGLQKKNTDTNTQILNTLQTMDKRLSNGAGLSTYGGG